MAIKSLSQIDNVDNSVYVTAPYDIKTPEIQKFKTLDDKMAGVTINDELLYDNTGRTTYAEDILNEIIRPIGDMIGAIPSEAITLANEFVESPAETATATAASAGIIKAVPALVKKGLGAAAGAITGILAPTSTISQKEEMELLRKANPELDKQITEKEKAAYNEFINATKGTEYANKSIWKNIVGWAVKDREVKEFMREQQKRYEQVDPNDFGIKVANVVGNAAFFIGEAAVFRKIASKPRIKMLKDTYTTNGQVIKKLSTPTAKTRQEITDQTLGLMKFATATQMGGDYAYESIEDYINKTGDTELNYYKPTDAESMSAMAYASIGTAIEFMGGIEPILAGAFKKAGISSLKTPVLKATLISMGGEAAEETAQTWLEGFLRKTDGTTNKTWGQIGKESAQAGLLGGIGGIIGGVSFARGRANLARVIKQAQKDRGVEITNKEALQLATKVIENTAEAFAPENKTYRDQLREQVKAMANENIDEYDIEQQTDELMQVIAAIQAEKGETIAESPIFTRGVVNQLGWFLEGLDEDIRPEVEKAIANFEETQNQLKTLREQIKTEQDEEKKKATAEEIEKLEAAVEIADSFQYKLEFIIEQEKKRIAQKIQEKRAKARETNPVKALTEQKTKAVPEKTKEQIQEERYRRNEIALNKDRRNSQHLLAKNYFRGKIDRQFAKDSGIFYAWGFDSSNKDTAGKFWFSSRGYREGRWHVGINDWSDILEEFAVMGWGGVEEMRSKDYQGADQAEEYVKDIILNNRYVTEPEQTAEFSEERIDDIIRTADDILPEYGYTQEQIHNMNYVQLNDLLNEISDQRAKEREQEEANKPQEEIEYDPSLDDIPFQSGVEEEYTGDTITVDGKERTVFNSNGDRIAKSKEALTNFWQWFGNSKVVDEQGRPLVVYHGNRTKDIDIKQFYNEKPIWVAIDKTRAEFFSNGTIYQLYAKIENPIIFNESIENNVIGGRYTKLLSEATGIPEKELSKKRDWIEGRPEFGKKSPIFIYQITNSKWFKELAKEKGFDGIITIEGNNERVAAAFDNTQIKSVDNIGTFSETDANIYKQPSTKGKGDRNRSFYASAFRFIAKTNQMDPSSLPHEFAHYWFEKQFEIWKSGLGTKEFNAMWSNLMKELNITQDAGKKELLQASETFARAYEAWLTNKPEFQQAFSSDKDEEQAEKAMQAFQNHMKDIYNDITNLYFQQTWETGKIGTIKPEIMAVFQHLAGIDTTQKTDLSITPQKTIVEDIDSAIESIIQDTTGAEQQNYQDLQQQNIEADKYEQAPGNVNRIKTRLENLQAQIQQTNEILEVKHDTHRNMKKAAEDADRFVHQNTEEAFDIINGIKPERDGIFKEELYSALERMAIEENDANMILQLKESEIAKSLAKKLGQRVAAFRQFNTDIADIMSPIKILDNLFERAYNTKKGQEETTQQLNQLNQEILQQDTQTDTELNDFFDSIKCKE